jgi:acyl transferase domain-containing protein
MKMEFTQSLKKPSEPIAICGIGCRLPGGVTSPTSFWNFMLLGGDGIIPIPADRWDLDKFFDSDPAVPGKMYVRHGGFLQQRIDVFDASFFGISPREAAHIDPQQRLLLETAWEAFEDAGIDTATVMGTDMGVFVGGFMTDNLLTQFSPLNREDISAHSAVGSTLGILANRLSYVFDLRGSSVAVDTACSSSLVAVHQACQAIWRGECSSALAAGVNIIHRPETVIAMCKGGFLSRDGRSESFDARADGYGRGEGAGVVILKPLSQAERDNDDIYAVIRATGSNQDGHTDGITVPNPAAQESLIRLVTKQAGIEPADIRYIEAHGTGTAVGDPLEAKALGAAIGAYRAPSDPVVIGSVKANIGHLEAASGIAGLIKTALCLKYATVPPLANFETPNPRIPFAELGLELPLQAQPLSGTPGKRYVGVNSFGYGGTNAHVVLQEAPTPITKPSEMSPARHVLVLSARSDQALSSIAENMLDLLRDAETVVVQDLCHSAACRRTHHEKRLVATGTTKELIARLSDYLGQGAADGVTTGSTIASGENPVFVFTGMGPQWWGMAQQLLESEPAFRRAAEACDRAFIGCAGWSILEEMQRDESTSRISETQIAQPANFLVQTDWHRFRCAGACCLIRCRIALRICVDARSPTARCFYACLP